MYSTDCGYLPKIAAFTMFASYMFTSNSLIIAWVNAVAVAKVATEYSAEESNLIVGIWTKILFPPESTSHLVSSSSVTWSMSFTAAAMESAWATRSRSISLPKILDFAPPTEAVFKDFSIPSKFTATVLLTPLIMFLIAGLRNGLRASIGTSDSTNEPLSSYKSTLSSNFANFFPPK